MSLLDKRKHFSSSEVEQTDLGLRGFGLEPLLNVALDFSLKELRDL